MPENALFSVHPAPPAQGPVGNSPTSYLAILGQIHPHLPAAGHLIGAPAHQVDRVFVRNVCQNLQVHCLAAYAVAMAWGGQNRNYFRTSLQSAALPILLNHLRNSKGSRQSDFDTAKTAAASISGLGISYFTKLLYFFRPGTDAYVLDQWTAKSAKLLFHPSSQVGLNGHYPSPSTTGTEYEWFCSQLDTLAGRLWPAVAGATGEAAETAIFDKGYGKGAWRSYVEAHFEHPEVAHKIGVQGAACLTTHQDFDDGWLVIRIGEAREIYILNRRFTGGGNLNNFLRILLSRIRELKANRVIFPPGNIPLPDWFRLACALLGTAIEATHPQPPSQPTTDNPEDPEEDGTNKGDDEGDVRQNPLDPEPEIGRRTIYIVANGGHQFVFPIRLDPEGHNIGYISRTGGGRPGEICIYHDLNNLLAPNYFGLAGFFNSHANMKHAGPGGQHAGNISMPQANAQDPYGLPSAGINFLSLHFNVVIV